MNRPSQQKQIFEARLFDYLNSGIFCFPTISCHLPSVRPGAILIAVTGQGKTLGHCAVLVIEATINQHLADVQVDDTTAHP